MTPLLQEIRAKWKRRPRDSHKSDFGKIFILAGSEGFSGAAYLCAQACVRSGAGLVTLGVPRAIYLAVAKRMAEVMVRPFPSTKAGTLAFRSFTEIRKILSTQDVLALGPGLSRAPETARLVRRLFCFSRSPGVLDADGINAFEGCSGLLKKHQASWILTPHAGEFVRIFGGKSPSGKKERIERASRAARDSGLILVLKGAHTVVASPQGSVYVNPTGNPGMASGGTGDVLTGIIAALLGQGIAPWDAARFGVYLHGLAGDLGAGKLGEESLIATDLIDSIPAAIQKIRGRIPCANRR
ncbi:MAG: NAD(P)H-hydrate dehydratase [Candidatus Omnitrophota bacterium]